MWVCWGCRMAGKDTFIPRLSLQPSRKWLTTRYYHVPKPGVVDVGQFAQLCIATIPGVIGRRCRRRVAWVRGSQALVAHAAVAAPGRYVATGQQLTPVEAIETIIHELGNSPGPDPCASAGLC